MTTFSWPETPVETVELAPEMFVTVTTPKDQAALHRYLALRNYCPRLLEEHDGYELWRFHCPS